MKFVKREFSFNNFRLDTLAFDESSKSFVIIEYKKTANFSLIDQGYSYLSLMLNNKAEFVLAYNESFNASFKKDDIDWSQSKVIFVSPIFNNYQINTVNKEVIVYTEEEDFKQIDESMIELYNMIKSFILNLDDSITIKPKKMKLDLHIRII